jgi:HD-like signal output (HDOD) protein
MIDIDKAYDTLLAGDEVHIRHKFVSDEDLKDYYNLFFLVLSYFDQIFLLEVGFTIIKEILVNAVKANAKRLHFRRLNLDINHPEEYEKGMESFAEEVTFKWIEQEEYLNSSEFYIDSIFQFKDGNFLFIVENSATVQPEEQERILKRIEAAKTYNDLSDAFEDMSDSTESAGLGLILTQILLKNSGIGREMFKMEFYKDRTKVLLMVPANVVSIVPPVSKFNSKALDEIEKLPPLPKTLNKILELCENPNANISSLSTEIEKDPALTADLLKLSNSAYYGGRVKVKTIQDAIKLVGLKNLKNLLYISGVTKIMNSRYSKANEIWEHSAKCSFFARVLSQELNLPKLSDIAATAGLLHDIGKLILLSIDNSVTEKVEFLKDKEKNNSVLVEEYTLGISHPEIAGKLLSKWQFPEELIAVAQYHHRPFLAPSDYRELVNIIYLANMMIDIQDGKTSYSILHFYILEEFGIQKKEEFYNLLEKIENIYKLSK